MNRRGKIFISALGENRLAVISIGIIFVYLLLAVLVPVTCSDSCMNMDSQKVFLKPFTDGHLLGCDNVGRDIWTRIWSGARISLLIGVLCAVVNSFVGSMIGGLCGYRGGRTDMIIMRFVDLLYGIPSLIVAFLIMMVIGSGVRSVILAICITGWIGPCRFMRGEVYRIKHHEYVEASVLAGQSEMNIIFRDFLPNLAGALITNLCMAIPGIIFQEAFFSYIGIGVQPPLCSWGSLAKEAVTYIRTAPHMLISSVFFIATTTLAFQFAGEGIGDALVMRKYRD